jgi:predicted PurR-regulated permease PerM
MNRVITWLKNIGLRQIVTVFLTALTLLLVPAFSYSNALQAQADTLIAEGDSYKVDSATIKRIQDKAEDLGDSPERPIGDTGLKNIKKLGENIPETVDLNARQGFFSGDPDKLDNKGVKERVEDTAKSTKRAIKGATS